MPSFSFGLSLDLCHALPDFIQASCPLRGPSLPLLPQPPAQREDRIQQDRTGKPAAPPHLVKDGHAVGFRRAGTGVRARVDLAGHRPASARADLEDSCAGLDEEEHPVRGDGEALDAN